MDAVFEDMKQDTTTFIGLMEHMKESKDALFSYFPQRDPRKATCKPHVPCIFDPMRARFICGKCWRVVNAVDFTKKPVINHEKEKLSAFEKRLFGYEQSIRHSRR
jgi:hypothetical protein